MRQRARHSGRGHPGEPGDIAQGRFCQNPSVEDAYSSTPDWPENAFNYASTGPKVSADVGTLQPPNTWMHRLFHHALMQLTKIAPAAFLLQALS